MYYTSENENFRKYGIVILEVYDKTLRTTVYHYRKPTPSERKEIILNYIIDNSGTPIKVNYLSSKLAVSDRTIQRHIKELANEGLIKGNWSVRQLERQIATCLYSRVINEEKRLIEEYKISNK